MIRNRRRLAAIIAGAASLGLLGSACAPGGGPIYGGPPTANWRIQTNTVNVVESQDKVCALFCVNINDEPYTLNLAFRVKVGEANSATGFLVQGAEYNDIGEGETETMVGAQRAVTQFPAVTMVDLIDLAFGAKLEIAGVWSWQMESDQFGVQSAANSVLNLVLAALNTTVAAGTLPSDTNTIVSTLLGSLGFGGAFSLLGTTLLGVTGLQDDAVGSRMYLGLGVTGTLGGVIDATAGGTPFPALAIPVVNIPPDISGGRLFRWGALASFTDNFDAPPAVDGIYNTNYQLSSY